jgi:hypothetical protein
VQIHNNAGAIRPSLLLLVMPLETIGKQAVSQPGGMLGQPKSLVAEVEQRAPQRAGLISSLGLTSARIKFARSKISCWA